MIIDIESYQKYLKGFYIYDCTYGYEHGKVGLSLIEVVDEEHAEYENPFYPPEKRLISITFTLSKKYRIYGRRATGISLMTISSGWPPSQTEYVMVSQDRDVMSYKEDVYKGVEESIN
ncbi:TPA: hypothetical protein OBS16_005089, partial [Escherichia coli]|nr:hypothetical protein [Escherichia coli]